MAEHTSYITLESVIKDYLNESEQSEVKYFKCWHLGYRGLEILGLDAFYKIQSVKLPINANLTVTLPSNYKKWTKVGVLNSYGAIIPLWYNENFSTFADLLPNRVTQTTDDTILWGEWNNNTWFNWWNGSYYTNIYGVPSGKPVVGEFKVDEENGVILLNHRFTEHYEYLMLEYVAGPQPVEGRDYHIPVQFREALIAWLYWRDGKAKGVRSHMQLGTNRDNKHDFFVERRNAIARWKPTRISEMYQASQEMSRLAIKS